MATVGIISLLTVLLMITPLVWGLQGDAEPTAENEGELKITTIELAPYTMFDEESGSLVGFIPDLLKELCAGDYLSCDYKLELVPDKSWGQRGGDGQWSGMMGQIQRKEVDLAAAPLVITGKRRMDADFTEPIGDDNSLTLLFKNDFEPPIENLAKLLERNDTKIGCIKGGTTMESIKQNPTDPFPRLWQKMSSMDNTRDSVYVKNIKEAVEKVLEGKYVFIGEKDMLEYQAALDCNLGTADSFLPTQVKGFALPKESPLKEKLNEGITKLTENDKVKELRDKWWNAPEHCDGCRSASSVFIMTLGGVVAYMLSKK